MARVLEVLAENTNRSASVKNTTTKETRSATNVASKAISLANAQRKTICASFKVTRKM